MLPNLNLYFFFLEIWVICQYKENKNEIHTKKVVLIRKHCITKTSVEKKDKEKDIVS